MTKAEIRKKYKTLRSRLHPEDVADQSLSIANHALEMEIWKGTYYHIFLPIAAKKEVDTSYLMHILHGKDKNIVVPKSDFHSFSMDHILLTDSTTITENHLGIPEPKDGIPIPAGKLDVVFVPLLAYDRSGNRVGYGKGFYDRFLNNCRSDCLKIGLSYFSPEKDEISAKINDIAINYCITPKRIWKF